MNPFDELPPAKKTRRSNDNESCGIAECKESSEIVTATAHDECVNPTQSRPRDLRTITEAIEKHLTRDANFSKAAGLFSQLINAELNNETSELFYTCMCTLMCECSSRDVTDKKYFKGYCEIFEALNGKLHLFPPSQRYRLENFSVYSHERIQLLTDDSFIFAKICRRLKQMVEQLNIINDATASDLQIPDSELFVERQSVLLCAMETAFRNYRWQWARQPCDAVFAAAAERRLIFNDSLREQLDELTIAIVAAQRKSASYVGPKTFRAFNSTAHPLLSKRAEGGPV